MCQHCGFDRPCERGNRQPAMTAHATVSNFLPREVCQTGIDNHDHDEDKCIMSDAWHKMYDRISCNNFLSNLQKQQSILFMRVTKAYGILPDCMKTRKTLSVPSLLHTHMQTAVTPRTNRRNKKSREHLLMPPISGKILLFILVCAKHANQTAGLLGVLIRLVLPLEFPAARIALNRGSIV